MYARDLNYPKIKREQAWEGEGRQHTAGCGGRGSKRAHVRSFLLSARKSLSYRWSLRKRVRASTALGGQCLLLRTHSKSEYLESNSVARLHSCV